MSALEALSLQIPSGCFCARARCPSHGLRIRSSTVLPLLVAHGGQFAPRCRGKHHMVILGRTPERFVWANSILMGHIIGRYVVLVKTLCSCLFFHVTSLSIHPMLYILFPIFGYDLSRILLTVLYEYFVCHTPTAV